MRSFLLVLVMGAMAFPSPSRYEDECLSCALDTDLLWPPNHVLADVGLHVEEHIDPAATHATTIEVYSDEDDVWPASARFSPDASESTGHLRLRSERDGRGDGRVYLIIVTVADTDAAGVTHWHVCHFTVVVPHDLSDASIASVRAQALEAEEYWAEHGEVPAEYYLVGDGPVTGSKQ